MTLYTTGGPAQVYVPNGDDQTIVVAPFVSSGGVETFLHQNIRFQNYGTLMGFTSNPTVWFDSNGSGIFINEAEGVVTGPSTNAAYPAVLIEHGPTALINDGDILSNNHCIAITGSANNVSVVNSGDLYAALNGIWVSASGALNVTISNSGHIWGDANGIDMEGAQGAAPVIFNSGVITGRANSIVATSGDRLNVTNTGTLEGNVATTSANLADSVVNNGKILGNVSLGSGVDLYRGTGIVTGTVFGEDGNDNLSGGISADHLNGGNNSDKLAGGKANDVLTGGGGSDIFVFDTAPNTSSNRDTITDFTNSSGNNDTFQLDNAVLTKLGSAGALKATFFFAGAAAHDADDHIIYNHANGALYYDSNGNAAGGSVQFAVLSNHPILTASDFVVI